MKRLRSRDGFALIIAALVLLLFTRLAIGFSMWVFHTFRHTEQGTETMRGAALAQSGTQKAYDMLSHDTGNIKTDLLNANVSSVNRSWVINGSSVDVTMELSD